MNTTAHSMRLAARLFAAAALLTPACGDGESDRASGTRTAGSLDLDIRDHADITLALEGDTVSLTLRVSKGFGVLPAGTEVRGAGRVEHFPEAELTLYTAKIALPSTASGPCGEEPVSVALSLYRRGSSERVGGALTPYCGKDTWFGTPARAPLRITGRLGLPK
ncbi:MAG: hypothetical protein R3B13_18705 [Polyangiaceae bacterium]